MNVRRRWDTDERGHGTRDAAVARPAVESLLEAMSTDRWVAEEPEQHLLPHLTAAAAAVGADLLDAQTVNGVLEVRVRRGGRSPRDLRQLVFVLVGSLAEASTHVRQEGDGRFEVVTGMLEGDGDFAPHGHLLRLRFE